MSFNNRSDALIELLEELTQRTMSTSLSAVTLSQRSMLASQRTSISSSRRTPRLTSSSNSLERQGFEETDSHAKEWFYDTKVIEYEKRLTPQQPIGFDLPVNGLGCRQTEGTVVVRLPVRPQPPTGGERRYSEDHSQSHRWGSPRGGKAPQRP